MSLRTALLLALAWLPAEAGARAEPVPLPASPRRPAADAGPTRIFVDAWFADISAIDSAEQSFAANLALVLRWSDRRLAHAAAETRTYATDELWHPRWLIANEGGDVRRSLPEVVDVTPDGQAVYRQRLLGSFSQALDLHRFPFDRATFRIHLVLPGHRPEEFEFVPDPSAVAAGLPAAVGAADRLTLQDWRVTSFDARPMPYDVARGFEIAGYVVEFTASRASQHYVLKVMLPLVLIVMMSWAVFWIHPGQVAPQVTIAITSMLTLIAYRFAVGHDVPNLPYLTLLDRFILTSSLLVFLSLFEVLVTTTLAARGREAAALAVDRNARWLFPAAFALVSAAILLG